MKPQSFWYVLFAFLSTYVLLEQMLDPYWAGFELSVSRHEDMLSKKAQFYNPWQYRILSTYLLEGLIQIYQYTGIKALIPELEVPQLGISLRQHLPFILVKWLLLFVVFISANKYFIQLKILHASHRLMGLWLLGFAMYPMQFSGDLSLDIYIEVSCYLLAACYILKKQYYPVIILTFIAALNRESSGFIPILLGIYIIYINWDLVVSDIPLNEKLNRMIILLAPSILSGLIYLIVFMGIRYHFGYVSPSSVYGNQSYWEFFTWNFSQPTSYIQFIRTFTLYPLLIVITFRKWPQPLKIWSICMLSAWIFIHLGWAVVRETRLFLVPLALLIIPGVIIVLLVKKREAIK